MDATVVDKVQPRWDQFHATELFSGVPTVKIDPEFCTCNFAGFPVFCNSIQNSVIKYQVEHQAPQEWHPLVRAPVAFGFLQTLAHASQAVACLKSNNATSAQKFYYYYN